MDGNKTFLRVAEGIEPFILRFEDDDVEIKVGAGDILSLERREQGYEDTVSYMHKMSEGSQLSCVIFKEGEEAYRQLESKIQDLYKDNLGILLDTRDLMKDISAPEALRNGLHKSLPELPENPVHQSLSVFESKKSFVLYDDTGEESFIVSEGDIVACNMLRNKEGVSKREYHHLNESGHYNSVKENSQNNAIWNSEIDRGGVEHKTTYDRPKGSIPTILKSEEMKSHISKDVKQFHPVGIRSEEPQTRLRVIELKEDVPRVQERLSEAGEGAFLVMETRDIDDGLVEESLYIVDKDMKNASIFEVYSGEESGELSLTSRLKKATKESIVDSSIIFDSKKEGTPIEKIREGVNSINRRLNEKSEEEIVKDFCTELKILEPKSQVMKDAYQKNGVKETDKIILQTTELDREMIHEVLYKVGEQLKKAEKLESFQGPRQDKASISSQINKASQENNIDQNLIYQGREPRTEKSLLNKIRKGMASLMEKGKPFIEKMTNKKSQNNKFEM